MHNAFLNIDNKKMSKSLGNFFTVREIGEKYDLQVLLSLIHIFKPDRSFYGNKIFIPGGERTEQGVV